MLTGMTGWESYLAQHRNRLLERYFDYLRIPSISAQDEHIPDVARAGRWVADHLRSIGIANVEVMPTGCHPVVYGDHLGWAGRPANLGYGHLECQPVVQPVS